MAGEHHVAQRTGGGQIGRSQGIALGLVLGTDDHEHHLRPDAPHVPGRREQLAESLLPHQASDGADHHGVGAHAEPGAGLGRRARAGVETRQVDPVAQQDQLVGGQAQAAEYGQVLGVLDQFDLRAGGRRPLQGIDHRFAGAGVLRCGVEPVDGVDDAGYAGHPGGHPPVQAGFGIVGVDDVGPEPAEQLHQLRKGQQVIARRHRAGGVPEGMVGDAPGGELVDERTGCRRRRHLHARLGESAQLRSEEQGQADVGGGDVDQTAPVQRRHPAAPGAPVLTTGVTGPSRR